MTDEEIGNARARYLQQREAEGKNLGGKVVNYPDNIYRRVRERPLLIVHLLKIMSESGGKEHDEPVAAWSISFPATKLEEKRVEYVVNTTWLRENFREDLEEEEMDGEP